MGKLIYGGILSLDGYIADENGDFDWSAPDEEVHAFVNDRERPVGTYLYGRRLYEVMEVWETMPLDDEPEVMRDYARLWRAAEKIVYSTSLPAVSSSRTRLERSFDPAAVRVMKNTSPHDLGIGGATLAATALRAGLVDELWMLVSPVVVGGGTAFLPDDLKLSLALQETRSFGNGVVYLSYAVRT
jgi:dihydrofolate reductase